MPNLVEIWVCEEDLKKKTHKTKPVHTNGVGWQNEIQTDGHGTKSDKKA